MSKIVMDLEDRRPAWAPPAWVAEEIRSAMPPGWVLEVLETPADGSGDGVANPDAGLVEVVQGAEVYLGYGIPASILRSCPSLRWVHSAAAGVRGSLTPEMRASPVIFTNSRGIHGPPMGDTALAMILYFARGLDFAVTAQAKGEWNPGPFFRADHPLVELASSTVGIFGYGGVGQEVGKRVLALGGRVLAYDLRPLASDPPRLEALHGREGFLRLLSESDFLVLCAPQTPRTEGLFDAEALARLKPGAVLVNLSRGALVDEEALVQALREGRLRGAALDVFSTEPLPHGHPLWSLPNVLLTPHVSAVSRRFWRRQTDLIVENLRRYLAGEPLLNVVDKVAGF